ncbi:hypothetical protein F0919_07685 [Taibaiella lutea]|uniref:DUF5723 domain-containing protein n=1 Tax=Taibaiella lutea TaxID=2608001 RepID=A0A5M6CH09_9BACT|nr:hypothetical protein [Taibaiella lutea]KAA5534494.1 hypothetical protein F0919_07685 [Taibaiella lutea]
MQKVSLLLIAFLCLFSATHAQGLFGDPDLMSMDMPDPNKNLYNISPDQYNHHFEYQLPNDGILKIDFLRLSDWGDKNMLSQITDIAATQVQQLKDSFRSDYSEKLLEINIPINNKVLSLNYKEDEKNKNQLAYKDGSYYQLKTGFDTIRIVKNVSIKTKPIIDSGLVQIQYTFILKDINDIAQLKSDPALMERLGNITDSVINEKRKSWNRQDATSHNLTFAVDANNGDSLAILRGNRPAYGGHFGLFLGFGAIVYNNSISPYVETTFAYLIPTRGKMQGFAGVNFSGFGMRSSTSTLKTTVGFYRSYNAEIGVCKKSMGLMPQKTSLLIGIMDIKDEKPLFNLGFNFGINRFASVGFNLAGNFKKEDKGGRYVYGVNFKFNL